VQTCVKIITVISLYKKLMRSLILLVAIMVLFQAFIGEKVKKIYFEMPGMPNLDMTARVSMGSVGSGNAVCRGE
jgi:hypothetical protein